MGLLVQKPPRYLPLLLLRKIMASRCLSSSCSSSFHSFSSLPSISSSSSLLFTPRFFFSKPSFCFLAFFLSFKEKKRFFWFFFLCFFARREDGKKAKTGFFPHFMSRLVNGKLGIRYFQLFMWSYKVENVHSLLSFLLDCVSESMLLFLFFLLGLEKKMGKNGTWISFFLGVMFILVGSWENKRKKESFLWFMLRYTIFSLWVLCPT
uniref:Uncharacterized protein n=1 Tax=Rhizophora mucronata TaxID=61149 RepID=A0A2P2LWS7_RHIMU